MSLEAVKRLEKKIQKCKEYMDKNDKKEVDKRCKDIFEIIFGNENKKIETVDCQEELYFIVLALNKIFELMVLNQNLKNPMPAIDNLLIKISKEFKEHEWIKILEHDSIDNPLLTIAPFLLMWFDDVYFNLLLEKIFVRAKRIDMLNFLIRNWKGSESNMDSLQSCVAYKDLLEELRANSTQKLYPSEKLTRKMIRLSVENAEGEKIDDFLQSKNAFSLREGFVEARVSTVLNEKKIGFHKVLVRRLLAAHTNILTNKDKKLETFIFLVLLGAGVHYETSASNTQPLLYELVIEGDWQSIGLLMQLMTTPPGQRTDELWNALKQENQGALSMIKHELQDLCSTIYVGKSATDPNFTNGIHKDIHALMSNVVEAVKKHEMHADLLGGDSNSALLLLIKLDYLLRVLIDYMRENSSDNAEAINRCRALLLELGVDFNPETVNRLVARANQYRNKEQEKELFDNSAKVFSALLNAGANPNLQAANGDTASHLILRYNLKHLLPKILAKNPDLTLVNDQGNTVFHEVVKAQSLEALLTLRLQGEESEGALSTLRAVLAITNSDGENVLQSALALPESDTTKKIIENLLEASAVFHEGIDQKNTEAFLAMLEKYWSFVSLSSVNSKDETLLHTLIRLKQWDWVEKILAERQPIPEEVFFAEDDQGRTLLYLLIEMAVADDEENWPQYCTVFHCLLEQGSNINTVKNKGRFEGDTVLHLAVKRQRIDIVREIALIDDVDLTKLDKKNRTSQTYLLEIEANDFDERHKTLLSILIEAGASITETFVKYDRSVYEWMVRAQREDCMVLYESGESFPVDLQKTLAFNIDGEQGVERIQTTPMHWLMAQPFTPMQKRHLRRLSTEALKIRDKEGYTVLHAAMLGIDFNNPEDCCVRIDYLLEQGLLLHGLTTERGDDTVISSLELIIEDLEKVRYCLSKAVQYDFQLTEKNKLGETLLQHLFRSGSDQLILIFFEELQKLKSLKEFAGTIAVDSKDDQGTPLIHGLARMQSEETALVTLNQLYDLDPALEQTLSGTCSQGNTVLHLVAQQEYPNLMNQLIFWGADLNQRNKRQQTPAHVAVIYRNTAVVMKVLTESKPVEDDQGRTPLQLALVSKDFTLETKINWINRLSKVHFLQCVEHPQYPHGGFLAELVEFGYGDSVLSWLKKFFTDSEKETFKKLFTTENKDSLLFFQAYLCSALMRWLMAEKLLSTDLRNAQGINVLQKTLQSSENDDLIIEVFHYFVSLGAHFDFSNNQLGSLFLSLKGKPRFIQRFFDYCPEFAKEILKDSVLLETEIDKQYRDHLNNPIFIEFLYCMAGISFKENIAEKLNRLESQPASTREATLSALLSNIGIDVTDKDKEQLLQSIDLLAQYKQEPTPEKLEAIKVLMVQYRYDPRHRLHLGLTEKQRKKKDPIQQLLIDKKVCEPEETKLIQSVGEMKEGAKRMTEALRSSSKGAVASAKGFFSKRKTSTETRTSPTNEPS